jgi:preprotein translocase subunit SecF
MFDFVGKRRWFLLVSAIFIVAGIVSLALPGGIKPGIDFEGGISVTLGSKEGGSLDRATVEQKLTDLGQSEAAARVQELGGGDFFIRTRELDAPGQEELRSGLGEIGEVKEFGSISAVIAGETVRNAGIAVAVAAIAILLYITWAFRRMPNPFRYGTCAIIALIHDILVVLAIFSFLGRALDWEIDPMFVTACLAVIGYSVNNTIVVFDRLRENIVRGASADFGTVVNLSLTGTLGRSINTSITTVLVVLAVYLFVGGTIRTFVLALFVGVLAGTYSSLFIAAQLLVLWEGARWTRTLARVPVIGRIGTGRGG